MRPDWPTTITNQGLTFYETTLPSGETISYWGEGSYYEFTQEEIDLLEAALAKFFEKCIEAGDYVLAHEELLLRMGIPKVAHAAIRKSWNRDVTDGVEFGSVFGRPDVCFGGLNHPDPKYRIPKFLELNADTPTSLPEAAVIQWNWLEDIKGRNANQWNNIHTMLIEAWKRNMDAVVKKLGHVPRVYFAYTSGDQSGEDLMNVHYLAETCAAAGYDIVILPLEDLILAEDGHFYYDESYAFDATALDESVLNRVEVCFKLFPWEHIWDSPWCERLFAEQELDDATIWFEAPYKMLWSNKAFFAVLWMLFKDDPEISPYLLPAYFDDAVPSDMGDRAIKAFLSREGANITVVNSNGETVIETGGVYGAEGYIVQAYHELPSFPVGDGTFRYPVLGPWIIDGLPAGMGIRESAGPITDNQSTFVPHAITLH